MKPVPLIMFWPGVGSELYSWCWMSPKFRTGWWSERPVSEGWSPELTFRYMAVRDTFTKVLAILYRAFLMHFILARRIAREPETLTGYACIFRTG